MQHITVPTSEVVTLLLTPGYARISDDNTHMVCVIGETMHILIGNFDGIKTDKDLEEFLKMNL